MSIPKDLHLLLEQGAIPFVDFMHHALYAPETGYYTSGLAKLGPSGDFMTAPELTHLFGKTIAVQCAQILTTCHHPILFEFGAGSGKLCTDILQQLEIMDCLPKAYWILEVSGNLKARQAAWIQETIPHLADKIIWINGWPEAPFEGVIIANEVLDAMPVHRFLHTEEGLFESFVQFNPNDNDSLSECFKPMTPSTLLSYIQDVLPFYPLPYQSEVNLCIPDWVANCAKVLKKGLLLLIDYGFPRMEYYHPDRNTGTLMCHYQHQAHTNPFVHVGKQDITTHVDFTHVAEAAADAGFHVSGFTNQAAFLLSLGLLDFLNEISGERARVKAAQAVKQLLQPQEMGELFKVIGLTKGFDADLQGFLLQDKRGSL